MSFNGSGTFVVNTAGQPVVPNTVISATAFNALTNDLANGLSTCITKDGQTTPTANIPMGNNKITGLAPGTSGTDAANLSQVQGSTAKLLQSVTGTDTITAAMVPALTSYSAGQMFYFVAAGDNTGAVTINIDSLGAKSVTRDGSTALVAGDIVSGEVALIVYDGTRFQLLNGNSFTNLNVSNNLTLSGGTANGVLYLNGSKVATSGSALTFDGTNLGIGTASPAFKLDVNGVAAVRAGNAIRYYRTDNAIYTQLYDAGASGFTLDNVNGNGFRFQSAGTTQAVIDSSGNLGIGVTPAAWVGFKSLDFSAVSYSDLGNIRNGFYNGSNYIYRSTAAASLYQLGSDGSFAWYNAPSGTAGNAISFTQALTLDANVNLLLNGTTAPASGVGTFAIFNGTAPTGSVTNGCVLYAEDVSSSSELKVRDEAGNVTTLSPHNFSLIPEGASEDMAWAYYSEKGGKRINVDMLKLARMVEKLTGEKLVYEA